MPYCSTRGSLGDSKMLADELTQEEKDLLELSQEMNPEDAAEAWVSQ